MPDPEFKSRFLKVRDGALQKALPSGRAPLKPNFPDGFPELPEIHLEVLRAQVFTHRSFYARPTHVFEDLPDDPSPDNEVLEHLGDSVLSLSVTGLMREVFPRVRVGPSTKIRALVVGNPTLASISVIYRLPERLRMHPAQAMTLRASMNVQADLFESFVGGLYLDRGLEVVRSWLDPLFRPYIVEAYRVVRVQHGLSPDPAPYVPRPPPTPGSPSTSDISDADPSPQPGTPGPWPSPPPSGGMANVGHLSLFNQYIQQQYKNVQWLYSDSVGEGTLTTPIWVVRAMIDGECVGRGRGSTKKAARNEAAKEGLVYLGVYVPYVAQPLSPTRLAAGLKTEVHRQTEGQAIA
ncbi:ribonuclease III [Epithele typhae]|uniref:ribonuclease III n=1 Tax=Epithele typhae TaxID=378194 RepID=UPI00200847EF|nr:ribonuclease III [Epithele typhae]KAH9943203.1 ribonuclease III [Epithele typhae]